MGLGLSVAVSCTSKERSVFTRPLLELEDTADELEALLKREDKLEALDEDLMDELDEELDKRLELDAFTFWHVGGIKVPSCVPVMPNVADAPAARLPFQLILRAVTTKG